MAPIFDDIGQSWEMVRINQVILQNKAGIKSTTLKGVICRGDVVMAATVVRTNGPFAISTTGPIPAGQRIPQPIKLTMETPKAQLEHKLNQLETENEWLLNRQAEIANERAEIIDNLFKQEWEALAIGDRFEQGDRHFTITAVRSQMVMIEPRIHFDYQLTPINFVMKDWFHPAHGVIKSEGWKKVPKQTN